MPQLLRCIYELVCLVTWSSAWHMTGSISGNIQHFHSISLHFAFKEHLKQGLSESIHAKPNWHVFHHCMTLLQVNDNYPAGGSF